MTEVNMQQMRCITWRRMTDDVTNTDSFPHIEGCIGTTP
jgi:hypothetical protein